jgi:outer membrane lipoprotein LolB
MSDWEARQSVLAARDRWEFRGRVGIKTEDDGFNAGFRWEQQRSQFQASLRGPLGIGTVLIDGRGKSVELTDNDGVTTRLEDAEEELYARYGWTIPLRSLRYWALGIPDPNEPADIEFDGSGRASLIVQSGWTVQLERYRPAAGTEMPYRLTATHPTTRVRVIVDNWTFY